MLERLQAELKGNARLRIAIALIFSLLWLYLILVMRDALDHSVREHRAAAVKLAKLESVIEQKDWTERLNAAKMLQAHMEGALWRGETLGLARASFQDWLNQQMQRAAVSRPVISMGAANEDAPGEQAQAKGLDDLWKVKAKLTFDFNPESLNKLLLQVIGHTQHVAIENLRVTKEPVPRVEIMATAYFQKSEPQPSPGR